MYLCLQVSQDNAPRKLATGMDVLRVLASHKSRVEHAERAGGEEVEGGTEGGTEGGMVNRITSR